MSAGRGWFYLDENTEEWVKPAVSMSTLEALYASKKIGDETLVLNERAAIRNPRTSPIPYSRIIKPRVVLSPTAEALWNLRREYPVTVLCGPNNSGKSFILKQLWVEAGEDSYMLGVDRFSQVGQINTRMVDQFEYKQYQTNFLNSYHTSEQNTEKSERNLEQILTGLEDDALAQLFGTCKDFLGNTFSVKQVNPKNRFSPFYVDMDGEKIAVGSSGTRLLLTLLGILFDKRFSTVFIDEPELGLSPKVQVALSQLMYEPHERKMRLPHLKQLFIATHSHLFLDRSIVSNNLTVRKSDINVSTSVVQSAAEFSTVQFNLLGNDFESLFLPSAMVIVEGESDAAFLSRLFQLHLPNRKIALIRGGGDGETQRKLNVISDAFGALDTNPFSPRLFVLLDKQNSVRVDRVEKCGVRSSNIIVLSRNGIEYFYPQDLVANAFRCSEKDVQNINLEVDPIEYGGIRKTKKELADLVASKLAATTAVHTELASLVALIRQACE